MDGKFGLEVVKELNKFRNNPKSIQHQCEVIQKGFSRLRAGDPFLKEIEAFVIALDSIKQLPPLQVNPVLSEAAKKELPNFRGKSGYQKYRKADSLKSIVPEYYLAANPAMVADDGADEPINVLTKTLLDRTDKTKEGRKILCDPKFTQVGVAHEVFAEENMVILIFATKKIDDPKLRAPPVPLKKSKNENLFNIQYYESKDIKNQKHQVYVYHRIKGDIIGGDGNFEQTNAQSRIYSQGGNRPKIEQKTDGRRNQDNLRGNKTKTPNVTSARNRAPATATATAKNEKIQQTTMKRRNDGTSSKYETKTETRTTTSGLRGQPKGISTNTTKTTSTRTTSERPGNEGNRRTQQTSTTTKTTTTRTRGGDSGTSTKIEIRKETRVEEKRTIEEDDGNSIRKKYARKRV